MCHLPVYVTHFVAHSTDETSRSESVRQVFIHRQTVLNSSTTEALKTDEIQERFKSK